jgi:phosphatidylinositol alpha-1,6-mannosyltransferase
MRVLLTTTQFAPELGGVPQVLLDFCVHRPAEIELRVLSVRQREASFYREFDASTPLVVERVAPRSDSGGTSLEFARRLHAVIREWKPDLIFSGVAYPTAIIVSAVTRVTRTPFVVFTHSEDVTIRNSIKRTMLGWALKRARAVITVSKFTRGMLAQLIGDKPITIISPGIDLKRFESASPLALDALKSFWIVMTAGRLIRRKGQDMVIRALPEIAKRVPNVHYLVIGDGPDAEELRALAAQYQIADRVTFAGRVNDYDLPRYFFACDAYVMPTRPSDDGSEVEGFGIVFLEAAAAGKPVVAGRAGGVADAVVDGVTGILIEPTDANAIANAVIHLAEDEMLCRQLGANGRARVEREFTVEQFAKRVAQVLQNAY